jgi:hypothetical protein
MTREQSALETKKKIRAATCGKEIADAMIAHFKGYTIPAMGLRDSGLSETMGHATPIDTFNAPLLTYLS